MKRILLSTIAIATLCSTVSFASSTEDRLNELEDRLDKVETSTLTDKIDFGLTFRTRYDHNILDQGTSGNVFTTKLNLNMRSKVSDDVKFTGRLTSYKNWGNNYNNMYSSYDSKQGRIANDSTVFMERAYVDWEAVKGKVPVILTIGRQPSSDGPSWQFSENSVRKGTYDALLFDGAADGIVATMPLNKVVNNEGATFRLAYGKGVENESYANSGAAASLKDNTVAGAFLEWNCLLFPQGKVILSYAKASDIVADGNTTSANVGDMSWTGLAIEVPNITKGLDVFAHFAQNKGVSNGTGVNVPQMGGTVKLVDGTGSAYWLGARYNAGFAKLGVEYNHGSKNWFSMTTGSLDPLNKLATRGDVTDVYIIKDVSKATHVKLGYAQFNYDYIYSGYHIGTPTPTKTTAGANEKTTNIYAEFVVNF